MGATVAKSSGTKRGAAGKTPQRCAVYARISNDPEGREAGVERQVQDSEELIGQLGWGMGPYAPFIDNDVSASTLSKARRPQYEELLRLVREGEVDAIVFYTNGRLTRRPREYEDLIELFQQTSVTLKSVKSVDADLSTADGRMIARVLAAQDAAEAERISERVTRAFVQRRDQGRPNPASRTFGFEAGGEIVVPEEAELIREAARRVVDEGWSLGQIVKDWNERCVPTLRGAQGWSRIQVSRALKSPRTAGLIAQGTEILGRGDFEAILSVELQDKVKAALAGKRNGNTVTFSQRKNVLAGFCVCGSCGRPMKVNALLETDGETLRKDSYIVCSRTQFGCGNVKRNLLHVMGYIDSQIRNAIDQAVPEGDGDIEEAFASQVHELEGQLAIINEDLADLQAAFKANEIRFKDYNMALADLRTRQELTEKTLGDLHSNRRVDLDFDFLARWEDGGVEEKREIMAWAIDHIKMHPIGRVGPIRARELVSTATEIVWRQR